ncbi:YggT family protein, partial [Enterobacter cloacae]|uniref:YggT family protein n=1 Tax=Enterobacter cloacae TaxID=550 RepID=UPI000AAF4633
MKTLTFLLSTVIELYTMALLLRVWMQWARCDFYNPFSQFVVKITQPVVGPLRRIIPAMGPIDSASLLVAFILSVIKAIVLFMVITFQPIIWIAAVLILIKTIGLLNQGIFHRATALADPTHDGHDQQHPEDQQADGFNQDQDGSNPDDRLESDDHK